MNTSVKNEELGSESGAVPDITPASALVKARSGALFVDVRESAEINKIQFDVPDIIILPMSELRNCFEIKLPRNRDLVMVCHVGVRSRQAAEYLTTKGFSQLANLAGGIVAWVEAELPVHGDPGAAAPGTPCNCSGAPTGDLGACCGS